MSNNNRLILIYSSSAAAARTAAPPDPDFVTALVHAHVLSSCCPRIVQQVKGGFSRHQVSALPGSISFAAIMGMAP